MTERTS